MAEDKNDLIIETADKIFTEILVFRQYGAPAGISPKKLQDHLDKHVEHFLRRNEPESAYYEKLGDHTEYENVDLTREEKIAAGILGSPLDLKTED
jgi:hypothetical protein